MTDHSRRLTALADEIRLLRHTQQQTMDHLDHLDNQIQGLGRLGRRLHPTQYRDPEERSATARIVIDDGGQQLEQRVGEHRRLTSEQRVLQRWETVHARSLTV